MLRRCSDMQVKKKRMKNIENQFGSFFLIFFYSLRIELKNKLSKIFEVFSFRLIKSTTMIKIVKKKFSRNYFVE